MSQHLQQVAWNITITTLHSLQWPVFHTQKASCELTGRGLLSPGY